MNPKQQNFEINDFNGIAYLANELLPARDGSRVAMVQKIGKSGKPSTRFSFAKQTHGSWVVGSKTFAQ
jgi:hypothetical protein